MAEEKEIFRLGLDESEVAAKLAAIEARWAEVQRAMQGGGDVQAAGQAMQQEVAGLRDLAGATRGADAATQELLRNKQGFAAVLNMVGGQMGPYVGQVGQLASLLAAGGPVAVGMAGAAVGVGLLVGALRELAKASEEARAAEERRLAQAQSEKDREVQATLQMAERMQKAGFGPESVVAGQAMRESLRTRLAITGADDVIPTIIGAGVTDPDDAARLALLARSGERFGPRDAQRVLERRRGAADELLERQRAFRESDVGRLVAAGPATGAMPALTDDEIAFRRLRELGQLPPGVDSPEAMRRRLDVLER
ncbi:MAG TPA: hypothetical protein PKC49_00390, partial [Phycisphaerae bacterium]|nr:hypothetical protein [Phycisphaerae bacterium]